MPPRRRPDDPNTRLQLARVLDDRLVGTMLQDV